MNNHQSLKILAIGNSFSQDAARYLHRMAQSAEKDLSIVNLYIGGCSLERHWRNVETDAEAYDHEVNGAAADRRCSVSQILLEDNWDIVTMQQVSHQSGIASSYEPYLRKLSEFVHGLCPNAAQWIHQTWAYDPGSYNEDYSRCYGGQDNMYRTLCECYASNARSIGARIIPVGDVIQRLRAEPPFDLSVGGLSLCRDGRHLSLVYGRYAAAAAWLDTLTGVLPADSFIPWEGEPVTAENLALIRAFVQRICG